MTAAAARTTPEPSNDDEEEESSPQHQKNPNELPLQEFLRLLPKVELHAHLNGCIRESTLKELAAERGVTLSPHLFPTATGSPPRAAVSSVASSKKEEESDEGPPLPRLYNARPRSLRDCFDVFAEIPRCVNDIPSLRRITREALEDFASHHVMYLELRSTPKILLWRHNQSALATKRDYVETILAVLQEFEVEQLKEEQALRSNADAFTSSNRTRVPLRARFIVAIDRSQSLYDAREHVDLAISLHRNNPQHSGVVVGVDLGGNPCVGDAQHFLPILQEARNAGLRVTLHCGEVPCGNDDDNDGDDPTYNNPSATERAARWREAAAVLDFHPDRLGHALLLPPSLQRRLSELRIPVETCPTSNVMTLELAHVYQGCLLQGVSHHPSLKQWLTENHPLAIGTDDPGVFDTNATTELELVARAFELSPWQMANLVVRSMDYAFCDPNLKRQVQHGMRDAVKALGLRSPGTTQC